MVVQRRVLALLVVATIGCGGDSSEQNGRGSSDDSTTNRLERHFGTMPESRQAALDAFTNYQKSAGKKLYLAEDGTVAEVRLLGEVNENMVRSLKWFPEMTQLQLGGKGFRDEWLAHIEPLVNLTSLTMSGLPVGDAGFRHLEGLSGLRQLNAPGTKVTDAGMSSVGNLAGLEELVLMNSDVTDAGLSQLEKLSNLRVLSIRGTKVTEAGVGAFKAANPNCKVLPIK